MQRRQALTILHDAGAHAQEAARGFHFFAIETKSLAWPGYPLCKDLSLSKQTLAHTEKFLLNPLNILSAAAALWVSAHIDRCLHCWPTKIFRMVDANGIFSGLRWNVSLKLCKIFSKMWKSNLE
jgi:hypothetical protein